MWLTAVGCGALVAAASVQAIPLDIWRVTVDSARGQPLRARVSVQMLPGERIDPDCLSLGDERDAPDPDFPLVRNARFALSPAGDTIEFSSDQPVNQPALSVALRVQCPGEPIYVRVVNLLVGAPGSTRPVTVRTAFPGTKITVKRGDSLYGLARRMFPGDETAVRNLVRATVIANPRAFPDGHARPLQIGEKLVIPELRSIDQILASAAASGLKPMSGTQFATGPSTVSSEAGAGATPQSPAPVVAPRARSRQVKRGVELRLRLATEIDLERSKGVDEIRRVELRRMFAGEPRPLALTDVETRALELRVSAMRESQNLIDVNLRRLEEAIGGLMQTVKAMPARPSQATPPPQPVAPPTPVTPVAPTEIVREEIPSWIWPVIGGVALIVALVAFLIGRRTRGDGAMANHEAKIDALLKHARDAAGPLLTEAQYAPEPTAVPAPPPKAKAVKRAAPAAPAPRAAPVSVPSEQPVAPPPMAGPSPPPVDVTPTPPEIASGVDVVLDSGGVTQPSEVSTNLRQEMNQALDNTRSMFTDVDRFIALGRLDNAISLLQFQVQKDPNDREAWVKLLAVYRQQERETEFERAHREFQRLFPGEG